MATVADMVVAVATEAMEVATTTDVIAARLPVVTGHLAVITTVADNRYRSTTSSTPQEDASKNHRRTHSSCRWGHSSRRYTRITKTSAIRLTCSCRGCSSSYPGRTTYLKTYLHRVAAPSRPSSRRHRYHQGTFRPSRHSNLHGIHHRRSCSHRALPHLTLPRRPPCPNSQTCWVRSKVW